jgi:hypothetical protein
LHKLVDRSRLSCTDIVDLLSAIRLGSKKKCSGDISDVDKVSLLAAVPYYCEGLAREFLG